ncbi:Pentatricopeptide repeat-containing protein [Cardamine amara subsp. amara]|uniref:Pentatricopeptide repeat-containing protein n=1 Tax=Cardamine amara subsp. amara TaxID=228776 RepID=A0ABD0Z5I3_CARAN
MLARVYRSESFATAARLMSTILIHRRVSTKGTFPKSLPSLSQGTFGGEELKLSSGFHYIKSLDNAIDLFDEMARSRPLYSEIDFNKVMGIIVRMNRPDVVISLYQKMEMLHYSDKMFLQLSQVVLCFVYIWKDH